MGRIDRLFDHERDPVGVGVFQPETDIGLAHHPQGNPAGRHASDGLQPVAQGEKSLFAEFRHDVIARGEIGVERRLGNADGGSDVPGRNRKHAALRDQPKGRVQNLLMALTAMALALARRTDRRRGHDHSLTIQTALTSQDQRSLITYH